MLAKQTSYHLQNIASIGKIKQAEANSIK